MPWTTAPRPLTTERRVARSLAFRRWREKQAALGLVRLRVFVPAEDATRLRSLLEARTVAYLAAHDGRPLAAQETVRTPAAPGGET